MTGVVMVMTPVMMAPMMIPAMMIVTTTIVVIPIACPCGTHVERPEQKENQVNKFPLHILLYFTISPAGL